MYSGVISTQSACTRIRSEDTWYDPHAYDPDDPDDSDDSDDSDLTLNYCYKFPDEGDNMWIRNDSTRSNCQPLKNTLIAPK